MKGVGHVIAGLDILNGFASKIISDCIDISVKTIKNADKNRKTKNQDIETRIYQVTIDALNEFTFNRYNRQDNLYDAAESILKGFKNRKDNAEVVRHGLKMLVSQVTEDTCDNFLEELCHEICKVENSDLHKEIDMFWKIQESEYVHGAFEKNDQDHEETHRKLDYVIERLSDKEEQKAVNHSEGYIENRAEEYAGKWDKNVFLNNFNRRDKNAGVNIKLRDIYLEGHLPHYIWKENEEPQFDLKDLLKEYIVDIRDKKMLLILGQPGIGKSTLITWIMANFVEKRDEIFVFQFASDLKNVDWKSNSLLSEILKYLNLGNGRLENRIVILDGFDEIHTDCDKEKILNQLYQELLAGKKLENCSFIITCRENYIYELKNVECDYITLQAWDDNQIESFCKIFGKESRINISESKVSKILENKDILGIPLILYMVLALDITIEEDGSIADVYDKIFSLEKSSIYDRCVKNVRYETEHRISDIKIKQQIHQISKKIAFWIFENNAEKASIPNSKYVEICEDVMKDTAEENENIKKDFLIGNYLKLMNHCGGVGTGELYFVHRSIYEYFVAVYFLESISKLTLKEEAAGKLGELLKDGQLSEQILEFIKHKLDNMQQYQLENTIKDAFKIMLQDGMMYYVKERYRNIINREVNVFFNMLKIVLLWNIELGKFDEKIDYYLQYNRGEINLAKLQLKGRNLSRLYLLKADLSETDLQGSDLSGADLSQAFISATKLTRANLSRADLSKAKLIGGDLSGADLTGANLAEALLVSVKMENTYLQRANLVKADIQYAHMTDVHLEGADLQYAKLKAAHMERAHLNRANLTGAVLALAHLEEADLRGAELTGADLSGTKFAGAQLSGIKLARANLAGTEFAGADLADINLSGAYLKQAIFDVEQAELLCEKYDLRGNRVYIPETNELISYEEYCNKKARDVR